jgi:hypothetical protein
MRSWDIWHVPDLPIYHLYHRGQDRPVHWDEQDDEARPVRWWDLHGGAEPLIASASETQLDAWLDGIFEAQSVRGLIAPGE